MKKKKKKKQDAANNGGGGSYSQMTDRTGANASRDGGREALQSQVFSFTTSVTKFQKQVGLIGTRRDTQEHRVRTNELGKSIKDLAKKISETLKASPEDSSKAKLAQDFQQVLKEFQRIYKTCLEKMSSTMPNVETATKRRKNRGGGAHQQQGDVSLLEGGGGGEGQELLAAEKMESQLLLDNQISHHDVLITEREEGIREIQGQIAEVGEIFQDLAVLVNEQGDMVNDIESNIISSHGHTEQAGRELVKAASHQKSARNRMCIIAVILLVFLIVLILIMQN